MSQPLSERECEMSTADAVLRATGITKSLGGNVILKGVDLVVSRHETVAIIGPSGAGKSTFLRCLNMLEIPDEGDVVLLGDSLVRAKKKNLPALRAKLGMVFQNFQLFPHLTALENITLAPIHALRLTKEDAVDRALELLGEVGLAAKAHAYPGELSGGQQQRVAIARALAMRPVAMLFDEPTSALDAETVHEVIRVMRDLSESGMTMIVVSHELGFVKSACSRLLFMDFGSIVCDTTPEEFFASPPAGRPRDFVSKVLH